MYHLFFICPFSQACWNFVGITWNLNLPHLGMIIDTRISFGNPVFMEVLITACRSIWCHRNNLIFDGKTCSLANWKAHFKHEFGLICIKSKPSRIDSLLLWLKSIS
ncbi:hypothetical protein BDA96_05G102700 [Sorghum bicolor]|uniref:Reverse transcriptase zinc-binding domain-containing protein n=2 Tax=Sorghum bicolor TaxID=4558 RepID=A0A921QXM9_SORBI|nr:hypothetical protein BDA96_05G102700 [Sorghum bicolor]OQU83268.1 hypothetical protein SORBI_3005G099550 [Sorghum bicolor]